MKLKVPKIKVDKIVVKEILKKSPKATYVIGQSPEYERSSYFNKEYEKEKNLLTWK